MLCEGGVGDIVTLSKDVGIHVQEGPGLFRSCLFTRDLKGERVFFLDTFLFLFQVRVTSVKNYSGDTYSGLNF